MIQLTAGGSKLIILGKIDRPMNNGTQNIPQDRLDGSFFCSSAMALHPKQNELGNIS
jgi:hypothetical protein